MLCVRILHDLGDLSNRWQSLCVPFLGQLSHLFTAERAEIAEYSDVLLRTLGSTGNVQACDYQIAQESSILVGVC